MILPLDLIFFLSFFVPNNRDLSVRVRIIGNIVTWTASPDHNKPISCASILDKPEFVCHEARR